jgi:hypothetical protein
MEGIIETRAGQDSTAARHHWSMPDQAFNRYIKHGITDTTS